MEEVLLFMTKIALGKGAIAKKKYYKRVNEKCLRDAQTQKYDFFLQYCDTSQNTGKAKWAWYNTGAQKLLSLKEAVTSILLNTFSIS